MASPDTAPPCAGACDPADILDRVALAAGRPGRDPQAALDALADFITRPLSDHGLRQVGAALSEVVAQHGGALPGADAPHVARTLRDRLAAHGVQVREVLR